MKTCSDAETQENPTFFISSDIHRSRAIRCVRRMSAETQLSASEGKVADIGGINILERGTLQHLWTLNDLHYL